MLKNHHLFLRAVVVCPSTKPVDPIYCQVKRELNSIAGKGPAYLKDPHSDIQLVLDVFPWPPIVKIHDNFVFDALVTRGSMIAVLATMSSSARFRY